MPVLQFLFDACCKHGFVLRNCCSGKITPVPKKNGVCSEFEEFRSIITVNIVGKIFEYCVLSRLKTYIKFHELQFGFTIGGGCDKALRSVIEYFNEYGSTVYLSALDISKAYDRLNHCAILLQKKRVKVPIHIILVFWYCFYH